MFISLIFGKERKSQYHKLREEMEARAGIEPANRGFAVPGLTTWLPRHAPKPLLSIDFAPIEQAKSQLYLFAYEIFNSL